MCVNLSVCIYMHILHFMAQSRSESSCSISSRTGFEQLPLDSSSVVKSSIRRARLSFSAELARLSQSRTCACEYLDS